MDQSDDLMDLLTAWNAGDQHALERLIPLVYSELHRIARRVWSKQQQGNTLQPTVLIHEAYLKLVGQEQRTFQSRAHFFAVASMAMRQVLVNHAEGSMAAKRGGGKKVPLDEAQMAALNDAGDLLALHDALKQLAELDPRKSRVVEMRYFGGLSLEETAEAPGVSTITVTRDWQTARAWLAREPGPAGLAR